MLILSILPFVPMKTPGWCLSPASSSVFARDALSSQEPIYHLWEHDHASLYLSRLGGRPTTGVGEHHKQPFCNTSGWSAAAFIGGSGLNGVCTKVSCRLIPFIGIPRMCLSVANVRVISASAPLASSLLRFMVIVVPCRSSAPSVLWMNHPPPTATLPVIPWAMVWIGALSFRSWSSQSMFASNRLCRQFKGVQQGDRVTKVTSSFVQSFSSGLFLLKMYLKPFKTY